MEAFPENCFTVEEMTAMLLNGESFIVSGSHVQDSINTVFGAVYSAGLFVTYVDAELVDVEKLLEVVESMGANRSTVMMFGFVDSATHEVLEKVLEVFKHGETGGFVLSQVKSVVLVAGNNQLF